jgi:uncharacterized coiled-coil DUF342 family protein
MMRKLILLIIAMTLCSWSYSQDTSKVIITNEQLKTANIIFAEHSKYAQEIPYLNEQIKNLTLINNSWAKTDSLRKHQLNYYNSVIVDKNKSIDDLNKSLKIKQNTINYGSIVGVLLLVCLIIK